MNRAAHLRALQEALADTDTAYRWARNTFEAARDLYDTRRRNASTTTEIDSARAAWSLAGHEWMSALITRETARDQLVAERRHADAEQGEQPAHEEPAR